MTVDAVPVFDGPWRDAAVAAGPWAFPQGTRMVPEASR